MPRLNRDSDFAAPSVFVYHREATMRFGAAFDILRVIAAGLAAFVNKGFVRRTPQANREYEDPDCHRHGNCGRCLGLLGVDRPVLHQHRRGEVLQERQMDLEDVCR